MSHCFGMETLVLRLNSSPLLCIPFPFSRSNSSLAPPKRNAKRTSRFAPPLPSGLLLEKLIQQILHPDQWLQISWGLPYQARLFWDMCVAPCKSSSEAVESFPPVQLRHASSSYLLTSFQERRLSVNSEALSKMWGSFVACKWTCNSRLSGIRTLWGPQHSVCVVGVISEVKILKSKILFHDGQLCSE